MELAIFDPKFLSPDSIVRCTLADFRNSNADGMADDEIAEVESLDVGHALALGGGAAGISLVVRIDPPTYDVTFADNQFYALHHDRPEPIPGLEDSAMARRIDGYLSRKAQVIDPMALVYCDATEGGGENWILEQSGEKIVELGKSFGAAKQAIAALAKAHQARSTDGQAKE